MPEQLYLKGLEPRPELDFLFFALLPAMEEARQILQIRERLLSALGLTGQPIARELFHVTLHGIGVWHGLPPAAVRTARDVGGSFSKRPFEIVFDRAMSFAGSRAFVLRASTQITLMSFHSELGIEMKKAGIGRHVASRFTPHMTLLYGDRIVRERSIEPVRWTVRDLVLVQSLRGRGQSKHVHLERWPLR